MKNHHVQPTKLMLRLLIPVFIAACGAFPVQAQQEVNGASALPTSQAVVNFTELARQQRLTGGMTSPQKRLHPLLKKTHKHDASPAGPSTSTLATAGPEFRQARPFSSLAPSPASTTNFLALLDNATVIPPDTDGAVGPNHVMTALNSQVRIQNRNGTALSTVSLNSFWAPLGGSPDAFDPHVIYDPYNNRWIIAAAANGPPSANPSAILVGVSQTSDPTGSWFLYQAAADTAAVKWADYPTLGFNTNWIIVSANMFPISGSGSTTVNLFVFSKTNLYAHGSGVHRVMSDNSGVTFTLVPSVTLDNKLTTEYLIEDYDYSSGISAGKLRISTITGPVGAEVLNVGIAVTATTNRWGSYFGPGNFLPQKGSTTGIDAGDSRILSNVYRNGSLWASHTAFLPAGGSPHRTAAQWWQIAPAGTVQQFGRIQDTGGTNFYAYPTIAVNSRNDTLLGYSRFATNQFASCNYSLRYATDAANTFRGDVVYKAGKASYVSLDSGGANRWGDYSSTVVDPVNDLTMWTIQEYAENTSPNTWSTWWARVDMAPTLVYARQRTNLVLSWTGSYFLQFSTNVVGTYIDVPGATSPYTNSLSLRFFRLRN